MMDVTIFPRKLSGTVSAIPSKSQAHRILICAALADQCTHVICPSVSRDIETTAECLRQLGAEIIRTHDGFYVSPIKDVPETCTLDCGECGSTLRFLLPVAGALGVNSKIFMSERLAVRPLSPLCDEMNKMGCIVTWESPQSLQCRGKLCPGDYRIPGNISSQFISGILFAFAAMGGECRLLIDGNIESYPYIQMTADIFRKFGVHGSSFINPQKITLHSPQVIQVEGDWSNSAFFITANALGSSVQIKGLNTESYQGDKSIISLLDQMTGQNTISVKDIPDLFPILSVAAAYRNGAVFTDIGRLRLKESDRIKSAQSMLHNLGIKTQCSSNCLTVFPGTFHGGTVDSQNDHRIAMSAAVASTVSDGAVTILGAQCVRKSYPAFWDDFTNLGGYYEQCVR